MQLDCALAGPGADRKRRAAAMAWPQAIAHLSKVRLKDTSGG